MTELVDDILLTNLGNKVLFIIRRRTKKGWFLPGSSSGADKYSTKPFAMPVGAASQMLGNKLRKSASSKRSKIYDPDNFQLFTSKAGNLWVIVKGGYKKVRQLAGKKSDNVVMSWTGSYMRDLGLLRTENNFALLGWKSSENEELAYFHEIAGAGKSKRRHKILGLLKKEEALLTEFAEKEILKKLTAYFEEKYK